MYDQMPELYHHQKSMVNMMMTYKYEDTYSLFIVLILPLVLFIKKYFIYKSFAVKILHIFLAHFTFQWFYAFGLSKTSTETHTHFFFFLEHLCYCDLIEVFSQLLTGQQNKHIVHKLLFSRELSSFFIFIIAVPYI